MRKLALNVTGVVAVLAGAVMLPLPIPFGAALLIVGLALLLTSNLFTIRLVRRMRAASPTLDRHLRSFAARLPAGLARALNRTGRGFRRPAQGTASAGD